MIGNGSDFALGHLGFQQLGQDRHARIERWRSLFDEARDRLGHAIHLQTTQHDDDGSTGGIMTHGDLPRSEHANHRSARR